VCAQWLKHTHTHRERERERERETDRQTQRRHLQCRECSVCRVKKTDQIPLNSRGQLAHYAAEEPAVYTTEQHTYALWCSMLWGIHKGCPQKYSENRPPPLTSLSAFVRIGPYLPLPSCRRLQTWLNTQWRVTHGHPAIIRCKHPVITRCKHPAITRCLWVTAVGTGRTQYLKEKHTELKHSCRTFINNKQSKQFFYPLNSNYGRKFSQSPSHQVLLKVSHWQIPNFPRTSTRFPKQFKDIFSFMKFKDFSRLALNSRPVQEPW